jgi:hypothetical protein
MAEDQKKLLEKLLQPSLPQPDLNSNERKSFAPKLLPQPNNLNPSQQQPKLNTDVRRSAEIKKDK